MAAQPPLLWGTRLRRRAAAGGHDPPGPLVADGGRPAERLAPCRRSSWGVNVITLTAHSETQ